VSKIYKRIFKVETDLHFGTQVCGTRQCRSSGWEDWQRNRS